MRTFLVTTALLLACSCARTTPIPDPESSDAQVYAARCGMCHSLPHPKRTRFEQWEHLVSVMETQIEHRGMPPLTEEDRGTILAYLRVHAR